MPLDRRPKDGKISKSCYSSDLIHDFRMKLYSSICLNETNSDSLFLQEGG